MLHNHRRIGPISGVTTMGSDRANPGAPNQNGPNGGPQAQAVEQKHWPGPLICHNVIFWPSEFCKISPQSLGNGISETLDSKIFRMSKPWTPRKLVHIRPSTRAFGTSTRGGGGPSKILNRGPPDITLRHWLQLVRFCRESGVSKTFRIIHICGKSEIKLRFKGNKNY
jgi:hypothetical protein